MTDASFPKERHLLLSSDFRRVVNGGRKIHSRNLLVFFYSSPQATGRLGVTVTKKYGKAVLRNRAKRVVREAFRLNRDRLPPGVDVVVIVKREAAYPTLMDFGKDLLHAFSVFSRAGA